MEVLRDDADNAVATGFAAMTHNSRSPFKGIAWVGLIAVTPELRGQAAEHPLAVLAVLADLCGLQV